MLWEGSAVGIPGPCALREAMPSAYRFSLLLASWAPCPPQLTFGPESQC